MQKHSELICGRRGKTGQSPEFKEFHVFQYPMPGESFEISMPISSKQGSS
jgi:hypothetical protein